MVSSVAGASGLDPTRVRARENPPPPPPPPPPQATPAPDAATRGPQPTRTTADDTRARVNADPAVQQLQSKLVLTPGANPLDPAAQNADKSGNAKAAGKAAPVTPTVDPTTRAAAATNFENVKGGATDYANLPKDIALPDQLTKGLEDSWAKSLPKGFPQEHGGILVQKPDGQYEFKAGRPGTAGSFWPNFEDAKPDERIVAGVHTHPYSKAEGGHTGVPFSGADLAGLVYAPQTIQTVQSGSTQFAAVPSKEFTARAAGLDDAGREKLAKEIRRSYDRTFDATPGDLKTRADAAARAVAQAYQLGYYQGQGGYLTRVSP